MSVVTSRSQVRPYSASRMSSVFGTCPETTDQARRYNERVEAYNRMVRSVTQPVCSTPKSVTTVNRISTPVSMKRTSLGSSEWKRIREENARLRKLEASSCKPRVRSVKTVQGLEVQKIIQNLNRVKSLLESSP